MTYPLERYLNGRSAMDGTFRPDARRLAFFTDITGTYQVWAVDMPPPGIAPPGRNNWQSSGNAASA